MTGNLLHVRVKQEEIDALQVIMSYLKRRGQSADAPTESDGVRWAILYTAKELRRKAAYVPRHKVGIPKPTEWNTELANGG